MEDSELPEQKYAMAFDAIPDKAEERTVMRNIEDMLYEENKLYASLFQAATRLLDQNPGMALQ